MLAKPSQPGDWGSSAHFFVITTSILIYLYACCAGWLGKFKPKQNKYNVSTLNEQQWILYGKLLAAVHIVCFSHAYSKIGREHFTTPGLWLKGFSVGGCCAGTWSPVHMQKMVWECFMMYCLLNRDKGCLADWDLWEYSRTFMVCISQICTQSCAPFPITQFAMKLWVKR